MAVEPEEETGGRGELSTLLEFLNQVADPRMARGVRYRLGAVPGLSVPAFVCGRTSLSGVSRFGRDHKRLLGQLGIARSTSPSVAALSRHYMFQIKADQPQRLEKMELVFAPQLARKPSPASLTGEKKGRVCRGAGGVGG